MVRCLSGNARSKLISSHSYRWLLAVFLGLAMITAGCGKFFPSAGTLVAISVSPSGPSIQLTKTQQFTAIGSFGDGTSKDVSSSATWSSSAPNIATINNTGLASAVATGTTTITATESGVSGSTTLVVTAGGGGGLTISCTGCTSGQGTGTFTAAAGSTITFSAADSSGQTVTATWSSSNTTVANIGTASGIAASVTVGTTTITATANGTTGSVTLTVQ